MCGFESHRLHMTPRTKQSLTRLEDELERTATFANSIAVVKWTDLSDVLQYLAEVEKSNKELLSMLRKRMLRKAK